MSKFRGPKVCILKFLCLSSFVLFNPLYSFGNEESGGGHDAPKAEEHGESHDSGGGHGDEKGKKMDLPPWTEYMNKISQLEAKMKQKMDNLERLVQEKNHVKPNSPQVKEIVSKMISEHKELQEMAKEHEKTITIFKFRFPERGAKADRKYEPTEVKSLEEIEQQLGVDGRLSRNMKKMRSQYGQDEDVKKKKTSPTETPSDLKKEKSIEESGTILIRK